MIAVRYSERWVNRELSNDMPTVVSLFTGASGLDYGFEAAGFATRIAVEMDRDCCLTLRANRDWPVIEGDIKATSSAAMLAAAGLRADEVDVLIGGPPCQPFSKSGYWATGDTKRLADPRASTVEHYMRCVRDFLPRVFVLENVPGFNYAKKSEGFELVRRATEEINRECGTQYMLSHATLNVADYGVPQLRTRFFLVADRDGRTFQFPAPTHGGTEPGAQLALLDLTAEPHRTAWDAIGDGLAASDEELTMRGRWADLLPSIPEGENYLWHTSRKGGLPLFGWRTRYWNFLLKLAKDQPSWTLQAQPGSAVGPFHWCNRRLSVRELGALQTFPDTIRFIGTRNSVVSQIGNAVPSLFAEILARSIGQQFFDLYTSTPPRLTVARRGMPPPAEPVRPVPATYLPLLGAHLEHPGTGKGPRSEERAVEHGLDASPGHSATHEWEYLRRRHGRCAICSHPWPQDGDARDPHAMTAQHIIPLAEGGTNTVDNIQLVCISCAQRPMQQEVHGFSIDRDEAVRVAV